MTEDPAPLGPKMRLVGAEQRRRACNELVAHVTGRLDLLGSRADLRTRHFAAMSLARLARLVKAMSELTDRGFGDVVDGIGRTALETFALGLYVLYGDDAAYEHVRGAHVRERRALPDLSARVPEWGQLDILENWEGPTDKINWQDLIIRRLPELVNPHDPSGDTREFFLHLYEQAYRFGSIAGTHAGIGTIAGHHADYGGALAIRPVRHTTDDGSGALVFTASLLALLASHVFRAFGVGAGRCDQLLTALTANPYLVNDAEG